MKKQKARQLNQVWSQKRLWMLAVSFPITLIPTRKLNADKTPLWHSVNSSVYGAWKHVKLPITENGWEPESTALFESHTKGLPPPAPADLAGWLDVFLFVCSVCRKTEPLEQMNRGMAAPALLDSNTYITNSRSLYLIGGPDSLSHKKSYPRAAQTFPFSVYLHMSDSGSNIRPLTDPSVLLHVLPFKSKASSDNAVYSSNDCVCVNGCATIGFCSFNI